MQRGLIDYGLLHIPSNQARQSALSWPFTLIW
jgi:hypothetical protein